MADGIAYLPALRNAVVDRLTINQSQLDRVAEEIAQHHWYQEQVAEYGLNSAPRVLHQAVLNVITQQIEAMMDDWTAEDWIRGDLGTELQAEIKCLGNQ